VKKRLSRTKRIFLHEKYSNKEVNPFSPDRPVERHRSVYFQHPRSISISAKVIVCKSYTIEVLEKDIAEDIEGLRTSILDTAKNPPKITQFLVKDEVYPGSAGEKFRSPG